MNEMPTSEFEAELLENFLDGELDAAQSAALATRLASDPALANALQAVSVERAARQKIYESFEADTSSEAMQASIARSLKQAATRETLTTNLRRGLRFGTGAAACLVIGLGVGWVARGPGSTHSAHSANSSQIEDRVAENMSPDDGLPNKPDLRLTAADLAQSRGTDGFNVAISDDMGRVVAEQHFKTLNEARDFSSDLSRWQTRQRQVRTGDVKLVGDDF